MSVIGSPEWFHEKAQTEEMEKTQTVTESRREKFIERFSPEKLKAMNGSELLQNVFGKDPSSMMRLLMFDDDFGLFGGIGSYSYLGIVYQVGEEWKLYEKHKSILLTREQAEEKALIIRDQFMICVDAVKDYGVLKSIEDYKVLQLRIEKVYFYQYMWVLKYLQILFPQYFPCFYGDDAINRAIEILGLPDRGNRFLNAGQIALFTRTCDVNSVIFESIYGNKWGWTDEFPPCPNAAKNYENSFKPIETVNLEYYRLETEKEKMARQAVEIEKKVEDLGLKGQERETVIKTRVNQGVFRELLLKRYNNCCLCKIANPQLLVASHIKPWAKSKPDEKLNPGNGFLLCPAHDKLFDLGLISFEDDGQIIISTELSEVDRIYTNIRPDMKIEVREENKPFLEYHRKNRFRG